MVPDEILADWRKTRERGAAAHREWRDRLGASDKMAEFAARMAGELPTDDGLDAYIAGLLAEPKKVATR